MDNRPLELCRRLKAQPTGRWLWEPDPDAPSVAEIVELLQDARFVLDERGERKSTVYGDVVNLPAAIVDDIDALLARLEG